MPKTKQFEAYDLSLFPPFKIIKLSMLEMSEVFYKHILHVYTLLEENKQATVEVPFEDRLYKMIRINSNQFEMKEYGGDQVVLHLMNGIELVNFLFAKAPFISLVGEEMGSF